MYCKKCGKKLPDDAAFCIHCGTKMDIHLDALLSDEGKEDSVNTTMLDEHIMSGTDKQSASSENNIISDVRERIPVSYSDNSTGNFTGILKNKKVLIVASIGIILVVVLFAMLTVKSKKSNTVVYNEDNEESKTSTAENNEVYVDYYYNALAPTDNKYPKMAKMSLDLGDSILSSEDYFIYDNSGRLEYHVGHILPLTDESEDRFDIYHYVYNYNGNLEKRYGYTTRNGQGTANKKSVYLATEAKYYYETNGRIQQVSFKSYADKGTDTELSLRIIHIFEYDGNNNCIRRIESAGTKSNVTTYLASDNFNPLVDDAYANQEINLEGWTVEFVDSCSSTEANYDVLKQFDGFESAQKEYEKSEASEKTDNKDSGSVEKSLDFIEGPLSDNAYSVLKGKFFTEDGENYVNVVSKKSIVRYIRGGNESHTYKEDIKGYQEYSNGYLIMVEWEGEKFTYLFVAEGETETILVDFDSGWNPDVYNYNYEPAQVYGRGNSTGLSSDTYATSSDANNAESEGSWGIEDAWEGPLPDSVFNKLKGTYYAEQKGITISVVSPSEIIYDDGSGETTLSIDGCDGDGFTLYIYVSGHEETYSDYQNVFMTRYSDNDTDLKLLVGSGTYNPESFNVSAKKISD